MSTVKRRASPTELLKFSPAGEVNAYKRPSLKRQGRSEGSLPPSHRYQPPHQSHSLIHDNPQSQPRDSSQSQSQSQQAPSRSTLKSRMSMSSIRVPPPVSGSGSGSSGFRNAIPGSLTAPLLSSYRDEKEGEICYMALDR